MADLKMNEISEGTPSQLIGLSGNNLVKWSNNKATVTIPSNETRQVNLATYSVFRIREVHKLGFNCLLFTTFGSLELTGAGAGDTLVRGEGSTGEVGLSYRNGTLTINNKYSDQLTISIDAIIP